MNPYTIVTRIPVMLVSPYSGDVAKNVAYAQACLLDSINHGEAPFAPHLIYPQALDDNIVAYREAGIACGFAWLDIARDVVVYTDRGISPGMLDEISRARLLGKLVVMRKLPNFVEG